MRYTEVLPSLCPFVQTLERKKKSPTRPTLNFDYGVTWSNFPQHLLSTLSRVLVAQRRARVLKVFAFYLEKKRENRLEKKIAGAEHLLDDSEVTNNFQNPMFATSCYVWT